jgi:hypothetical protein
MLESWRSSLRTILYRHPFWYRFFQLHVKKKFFLSPKSDRFWKRRIREEAGVWEEARARSHGGPKILLATGPGGYDAGATLESLLGVALTLRGADVRTLLCDEALPACFQGRSVLYPSVSRYAEKGPAVDLCGSCYGSGRRLYEALGFPVSTIGEFLSAEDRAEARRLAATSLLPELKTLSIDGMAVGEHASAGALRFFARADLEGEPEGEAVFRRYVEASILTARACARFFRRETFTAAVFHHGIYVPQGLIGEAARGAGVPVVNWNPAYRTNCFLFSHGHTYHHTLMDEPVEAWRNFPFTPVLENRLDNYLKSRWRGTQDWIWFHESPRFGEGTLARELGVDFSRPCVGLLTNVMWDAQLHYPANAFSNQLEWIRQTVEYFSGRPEVTLIIRVHPAEIRGTLPSRQPLVKELQRMFPRLPAHIVVIPPESRLSTYAVMDRCNAVLIYGTKTGVELAARGIPVIVAGEAWVRNKGLTWDATSPAHYRELLGRLPFPSRMDPEMERDAKRYAFHFFFRRMIPLRGVEKSRGDPPFHLNPGLRLADLAPGCDPGLDVVCEGILRGAPFVFPEESGGVAPGLSTAGRAG